MIQLDKIVNLATDIQATIAILFGMVIQFFLGDSRTAKTAITVILTSFFVALYIVRPILLHFDVYQNYAYIAPPAYALSTVISLQILAILMRILPSVLSKKMEILLGVQDDIKR